MADQIEHWEIEDDIVTRLKEIEALDGNVKAATNPEEDWRFLVNHPPAALIRFGGSEPEADQAVGTFQARHTGTFGVRIVARDLRPTGGEDSRADTTLGRLMALIRNKLHGWKATGCLHGFWLGPQSDLGGDPDTMLQFWEQQYMTTFWVYHNPDA
jgi:hypothetical protein